MGEKNATTPPSLELFMKFLDNPKYTDLTILEHYMKFLDNPKDTDLTTDQTNQILRIHGYESIAVQSAIHPINLKKIFEGKSSIDKLVPSVMEEKDKKEILEALGSIDLMVPSRSTLTENITSAFLPPDTMIEDLSSLQWHESSVQAVEKIGWKPKFSAYFSHEKLMEELNSLERIGWNQKLRDSASASVADTTLLTPPASSGTFIIAMLFKDGVFCATDSKVTTFLPHGPDPYIIMERGEGMVYNGKYIFLPGQVTMMYSGHIFRVLVLAYELEGRLRKYLSNFGIPMDIQFVAKLAAQLLNSHCDGYQVYSLECIFVGLSFLRRKPIIVGVRKAHDFEVVQDENVMMMGSGSVYVQPLLPLPSEISEDYAHNVCKSATAKAISMDSQLCGGKTWFLKVSISANKVLGPISGDP